MSDGFVDDDGYIHYDADSPTESRDRNYNSLESVLNEAYAQAAFGKGKERHATKDVPFEQQLIILLEKMGLTFCEGQAVKKIIEAHHTGSEVDLLGAINYIAGHIIAKRGKP